MDVTNTQVRATTDDEEAAIRTEVLGIGIIENPLKSEAAYQTAVDPTDAPAVMQVYRVGGYVRVYRPSGRTPAQAVKSIDLMVLDSSSVTPNNQVRLVGFHRSDVIRNDLLKVIGEIRGMQEPDVPAEYLALAEAACASQPTQQTDEEVRAWAQRLGAAIVED